MNYILIRNPFFVKFLLPEFSPLFDNFFPKNRIYLKSSSCLYEEHQKINHVLGWGRGEMSEDAQKIFRRDAMEEFQRMRTIERHKDFDRAKVEQLKDSLHAVTAKVEGKLN